MTTWNRFTPIAFRKRKSRLDCVKNPDCRDKACLVPTIPTAGYLKFFPTGRLARTCSGLNLAFKFMNMLQADECYDIFSKSIDDYHIKDNVDTPVQNPFPEGSFESLLYLKNWIDTVQWHLEDIIRNPDIDPASGIQIKRRIDKSNQERTDTVERMDDYFLESFRQIKYSPAARINSETPAWLLDRMSILMLKIFHMAEQTERKDVSLQHVAKCREKLSVLEEQKADMAQAFDQLIQDIGAGTRRFKVYRQMKMYNDETLNPVLYKGSGK